MSFMLSDCLAPRISVIIPLYNKAAYIVRAIESVLAQGEAITELIVVDDGSTDGSAARVEELGHQKIKLISQANAGVSAARNRGIKEALGEYIVFLDADDVFLPGYIDEILTLAQMFPLVGVYATSYLRVWPDGRQVHNYLPRSLRTSSRQVVVDPMYAWSRSSFIHICSICVKRSILVERNIQFPIGENIGEDQDVIFRLFETGNVAFSSRPLFAYTQDVKNSLYSHKPDYIMPCIVRLSERARKADYPKHLKIGANRVVAVNYLNVARILIHHGKRSQAVEYLISARPTSHPTYWLRTFIRILLPAFCFQARWSRWI